MQSSNQSIEVYTVKIIIVDYYQLQDALSSKIIRLTASLSSASLQPLAKTGSTMPTRLPSLSTKASGCGDKQNCARWSDKLPGGFEQPE